MDDLLAIVLSGGCGGGDAAVGEGRCVGCHVGRQYATEATAGSRETGTRGGSTAESGAVAGLNTGGAAVLGWLFR
ncbi:hypothetical protein GCM10009727_89850 [Actinomadura napierensis]|uniref:Uncharacterized protein n=1 Tax=Actinomadura napierensis TaxID=267854 RepID=A0ABP5MBX9_9ACTN